MQLLREMTPQQTKTLAMQEERSLCDSGEGSVTWVKSLWLADYPHRNMAAAGTLLESWKKQLIFQHNICDAIKLKHQSVVIELL